MTRRVRTSEPASDEFSEAVRWYEARRSGLGSELFDAVAATVSLIETNPEIGTRISTDGHTSWPDFRTKSYTDSGRRRS